jgi:asparagine synthase (glutamine-hydrolysing)
MAGSTDPATLIRTMRDSLVHLPCQKTDKVYVDPDIFASRVYVDGASASVQPCSSGDVFVWLDGEFYNRDCFTGAPDSDEALLLDKYNRNELLPFLRKVDGYFAAVIFDRASKKVLLITDRYGLRPLYVTRTAAGCAWASEIKALCCLPSRSASINANAARLFISQGHFIGSTTWFDDVELLAPATQLRVDCVSGATATETYWTWGDITPLKEPVDITETARELGCRFKKAVERRCRANERIGLGLSGGLDSRAIFAAIPPQFEPIVAATFGIRESADMRIARRVTHLRPSRHIELELNATNWLDNRSEAVWWTDGQMNILHMHGVEQLDLLRRNFTVDLNGFLGDALLGGSYGSRDNRELERFAGRGRRFIALGPVLSNNAQITRLPFFDNELMELTLAIPLRYRRNSSIYNRMLLGTFPEYYRDIPWQKTGLPISMRGITAQTCILTHKIFNKIATRIPFVKQQRSYADYADWLRREPGRTFITGLLDAKDARIFNYIDPSVVRHHLKRHLAGSSHHELLGRYATLELWLRRLQP